MTKYKYALFLMIAFCTSCGQNQIAGKQIIINSENRGVITSHGPKWITRNIIQDRKGNIWIAAFDGIFRYDGKSFTNKAFTVFTHDGKPFKNVRSIIEDKKGNIWTSSESADSPAWVSSETGNIQPWALTRYDGKSLSDKKAMVTEITNKGMIFGILEAFDGSIWFGTFDGVHRYDGKTITDFKDKEVQK